MGALGKEKKKKKPLIKGVLSGTGAIMIAMCKVAVGSRGVKPVGMFGFVNPPRGKGGFNLTRM